MSTFGTQHVELPNVPDVSLDGMTVSELDDIEKQSKQNFAKIILVRDLADEAIKATQQFRQKITEQRIKILEARTK